MIRIFTILIAVLFVSTSHAQSLNGCDWLSSAANIWEPWEDNTKTYANGAIRIAKIGTDDPACCTAHLLILSPGEPGPPGWIRSCNILSSSNGLGFNEVFLEDITTSYDPAKGLLLSVPIGFYDPENAYTDPDLFQTINVRINQATGTVTLE